jgi:hypothetical protein
VDRVENAWAWLFSKLQGGLSFSKSTVHDANLCLMPRHLASFCLSSNDGRFFFNSRPIVNPYNTDAGIDTL